jgi:FtsP/CotA-like multicopper oxidase with cupredoxin domain
MRGTEVALGRRAFLKLSGAAAIGPCLAPLAAATPPVPQTDPTHVLRIRKARVELAPGHLVTTLTYNGRLPGPLLRATVGQRVRVDVYNETDSAERIHWHGQTMAVEARSALQAGDGVSDVPAHSVRRMEFTPTRPGLFFYHSDVVAAANLDAGLYSGQAGGLLVEHGYQPGQGDRAGHYDREWVVVLKECEPFIRRTSRGCEIGYRSFTVNGRLPGHGDPARINPGERVLLHVLNASATEPCSLALPGHAFEVTALDGYGVPSPTRVVALQLSPAERISAVIEPLVELTEPVEWTVRDPGNEVWDCTRFDSTSGSGGTCEPDATLDVVLSRHDAARSGFNSWSINGTRFSAAEPQPLFRLRHGLRYRLKIRNTSDEILPIHLQHHRLELVRMAGAPTAAILKDIVTVGAGEQVEVDFVADNPGPALFYCTRQLHRDFGLMTLIDYT